MVRRSITVRIATPFKDCVEFLEQFTNNFWSFNQDNSITSLAVDDIDDYDYKIFTNRGEINNILRKREEQDLLVSVILFEEGFDKSLNLIIKKQKNTYEGFITHYELHFHINYGKRIEKANRYTDYGYYLNLLLPKLQEIGCYICEVTCHDFDC